MSVLFFDTETSDLPKFKLPNNHPSQPWVVQLAAKLISDAGDVLTSVNLMCKSNGLPIAKGAQDTHGISVELADQYGYDAVQVLDMFFSLCQRADSIVAHNISFDKRLISIMAHRAEMRDLYTESFISKSMECTMRSTTKFCALPFPSGRRGNKWPKLEELYKILFNEELVGAHDAMIDVDATVRCYFELKNLGVM